MPHSERVTLVHIGWPKTATTWLQRKVFVESCGYRQVFLEASGDELEARSNLVRTFVLPDQLEFDAGAVQRALKPALAAAEADGLIPVLSHELLCGSFENRLQAVVVAERLAATFPDLKVLIAVREQRAAMLARWQQYVRGAGNPASGPPVKSLRSFYGDAATRASDIPPLGDLRFFEYDRLVSWYIDRLGEANVLVLPMESLRADSAAFFAAVQRFSRAEASQPPDMSATNEAWAPLTYAAKRQLNRFSHRKRYRAGPRTSYHALRLASERFDAALPPWARQLGRSRGGRLVEELAGRHYVESNRRLQELVAWDLSEYGYMLG